MHLPNLAIVTLHAFRIDVDDDALAAESQCCLANKFRLPHSHGIDGNFVAAGIEQPANIIEVANSAADGKWHEDHF